MKRIVETQDGGFDALLGEQIALFCGVYIYTGTLSGVNADHLELTDPKAGLRDRRAEHRPVEGSGSRSGSWSWSL